MAIFNSYVKLPEGSESSGTKERGLCPPRSHCKPFVGGGLRLVEVAVVMAKLSAHAGLSPNFLEEQHLGIS